MSSIGKTALLCAAVVALVVFSLPAMASAARLEEPAGKLVPKGTKITLTSNNWMVKGVNGTWTCALVTLPGEVTKNDGEVVLAKGTGPGTADLCNQGGSRVLMSPVMNNLQLYPIQQKPSAPKTMGLEFTAQFVYGLCKWTNPALSVNYTSGNSLQVGGAMAASPAACEASVSSTFAVTNSGTGNPILITG